MEREFSGRRPVSCCISVPVGVHCASTHTHVRAHLLHTAHLHVLHWYMHL